MSVPGLPQLGELVKLVASQRSWSLSRSQSFTFLVRERLRPKPAGPRSSSSRGGSGETQYWVGEGANASRSK